MTQSGDVRSHAAAAGDQALEAPAEGVICVFDFEGGIGAPVEAFDPAARPEADWRWAHLRLGDNRAVKLLRAVGGLPQEALELFLDHEARVQIDQAGDWVFGVLPDYERDLGGRAQDEGRVAFAFDERSLVTGRLHALLAVDDLRHAAASGEALQSPAAAVTRLVQLYAERTEEQLAEIAAALEKVEDYVLA
ncbi:MAG: hypothetical protein JO127_10945 [Caulobacteraceae bacterium]|nr:hypothetical protein [Caulobacteraceae bacterium]